MNKYWIFGIVLVLLASMVSAVAPNYTNPSISSTVNATASTFSVFWYMTADASAVVTPTAFLIVNGTNTSSGLISNMNRSDGINLTIQESASDTYDLRINFSGAIDDFHKIAIRARYAGTPAHSITISIYNLTAGAWNTLTSIASGASLAWYNLSGTWDNPMYVNASDSNTSMFRVTHVGSGIASHMLYIDYWGLEDIDYLGCYIFQNDNSGTAGNTTACWTNQFEGWSNTTITLNATAGNTVNWKYYVNNTDSEWATYSSSFIITRTGMDTQYQTAVCPVTTSLQNTLLFIAIGIFIVTLFILSEIFPQLPPVFGFVPGIAMIFYSLPLFGCHIAYGLMMLIFAIIILINAWQKAWREAL